MPRGVTGANLLRSLKAMLGDFTGTNAARDAELLQSMSDFQQRLAIEFTWSFLRRRWDAVVAPNTQFVPFPTVDVDFGETANIDLDQLEVVKVHWNNQYLPMSYGIGEEEYNAFDFSLGQQTDPIMRYREASNTDETIGASQFEVWPVPVTQQTVRFTGQRQLLPLAAGTDRADLDDQLIILGVAAERLIRGKQKDGELKLAAFRRRLVQLGMKNPTRDKRRSLVGEDREDKRLMGIRVAIAGPGGLGLEGGGVIGLEG